MARNSAAGRTPAWFVGAGALLGLSSRNDGPRRSMSQHAGTTTPESNPPGTRFHVVGAGPVGLLLTALLQTTKGVSVRLYEKRRDYTRTRMVKLASYLVADSIESYRTDHIDGETVEAVFDPAELVEGLAFRRSIPSDLMSLAEGLGSGLLSAQQHRALTQRAHRSAWLEHGATNRRADHRGRSVRDGRAARRRDRLHRNAVDASRPP